MPADGSTLDEDIEATGEERGELFTQIETESEALAARLTRQGWVDSVWISMSVMGAEIQTVSIGGLDPFDEVRFGKTRQCYVKPPESTRYRVIQLGNMPTPDLRRYLDLIQNAAR